MVTNKKTTIEVSIDTKNSLDLLKIHPRQSYDEVLIKLIIEKKMKCINCGTELLKKKKDLHKN